MLSRLSRECTKRGRSAFQRYQFQSQFLPLCHGKNELNSTLLLLPYYQFQQQQFWNMSSSYVTLNNVSSFSTTATTTQVENNNENENDEIKPIVISKGCVKRLQQLQKQRSTNVVLRVTVDGGGCSGFQYLFTLEDWDDIPTKDTLKKSDDRLFIENNVYVIVDTISLAYISGSTVDYLEEMISSSFRILDNPNSEGSCGCGVSFSPKM